MGTVTYTEARDTLASVWDKVISTREPMVIKRRGHPDVALLPAEELSSLMETAYLLRSPANAKRLLTSLKRARSGKGVRMSPGELRDKIGHKPKAGRSETMPRAKVGGIKSGA